MCPPVEFANTSKSACGSSRQARRSTIGFVPAVAVTGAVLSASAEAWHAYSHLRLDTHSAPVAGILSAIGFLVVVISMSMFRGARRRRAAEPGERRAA